MPRSLWSRSKRALVSGAALGAIALPSHALAQEVVADPGRVPAQHNDSSTAGDIIVTARRSSERLQDVPVAVTAVSAEQVSALRLMDTRDLSKVAPALTFTQGSTTKLFNFVVRGVGTFVNSDGFDQSVGVAFDGVSLARPGGSIADLIDIERVEVLEGPQGMLFGRNASAGLINIISNKPRLGERSMSGQLAFGNYDEMKASAVVNLPIGDSFAVRAVGWKSAHDGYIYRIANRDHIGAKSSEGLRLRAIWAPTDALEFSIMGEHVHNDSDATPTTIGRFSSNLLGIRDYELAQGIEAGPDNESTSSPNEMFTRGYSSAVSAQVAYDLGGPSLTLLGSHRRIRVEDKFDSPSTGAPGYVNDQTDDVRYKQSTVELRINSDSGGDLKYVFGGIYFDFSLRDRFLITSAGAPPAPFSTDTFTRLGSKHYALFGEITYTLLPSLRIIAGGRQSWDRIEGSLVRGYREPPVVNIPAFNGPGAAFGPFSVASSVKDSEFSYRAGLQWDAAPDVMVYATTSRGYKAAGLDLAFTITQAIADVNQLRVDPEISKSYEIGLRSQFFDRMLTLNVTAFHEIFSDFQISTRLPTAATIFAMQNANELKSTGATVTLDARPADGLTISGNLAYVDARYTDFSNAACYPGQQTGPAGTPLDTGLCVGGVQSMNGKPLQNSPKWRLNGTVRYETPANGDGLSFFGQANVQYLSRQAFGAVGNPFESQPAYTVVNLQAGISADNWRFSLYGLNVFDQIYNARTIPQLGGVYYSNTIPYEARARYGAVLEFQF